MNKAEGQKTSNKKSIDKIDEILKYEVISELGLFEKVQAYGWKSLTSKETGRIGGLVTKKKKLLQMGRNKAVQESGI